MTKLCEFDVSLLKLMGVQSLDGIEPMVIEHEDEDTVYVKFMSQFGAHDEWLGGLFLRFLDEHEIPYYDFFDGRKFKGVNRDKLEAVVGYAVFTRDKYGPSRQVAPDGRLFPWGTVKKVHNIGIYSVVEYVDDVPSQYPATMKTKFHPYIENKDTSHGYSTLEEAIIGAIAINMDGINTRLDDYIWRMMSP